MNGATENLPSRDRHGLAVRLLRTPAIVLGLAADSSLPAQGANVST